MRTLVIGFVVVVVVLTFCIPVFAGKNTPAASDITGSDNQSTARQGHESGQATQAGPCGPACRRQEPTPAPIVTPATPVAESEPATVYIVYLPAIFSGYTTTPAPIADGNTTHENLPIGWN